VTFASSNSWRPAESLHSVVTGRFETRAGDEPAKED
jgi:hypothetical protein